MVVKKLMNIKKLIKFTKKLILISQLFFVTFQEKLKLNVSAAQNLIPVV